MEKDPILSRLLKKSSSELPDRNFEDRVMQKIVFAAGLQQQRRKNLKLSWIFLGVSTVLLPIFIIMISRSFIPRYLSELGINLSGAANILMPAAVLISAIIILVQLDNLYRLTLQLR